MAADIHQITESNQAGDPVLDRLDHILECLHAAMGALTRQGKDITAIKAELDAFAPVLAPFRNGGLTLASMRAARKQGSNGRRD